MIKKLRVTVDGKSYDVTVEVPDEPATAESAAAGSVAPAPAALPVIAPAAVMPVAGVPVAAPPAKPALSPSAGAGNNEIPSPLAGRVTAVNTGAGQSVKEGDHLLTLEAMKMNTFVTAPRDGTVKDVKVRVGDVVDEGQALASMEGSVS
jgi:biotin carboxyl carrier protein